MKYIFKILKWFINTSLYMASFFIIAILCMVMAAMAPELHRDYLRDQVGGKVVKVMAIGVRSGGTGFHMQAASGTYILTNGHVCGVANKKGEVRIVYTENGIEKTSIKHVVKKYEKHDLCLIEPIEGFKALHLGTTPKIGDTTYVYGHPGLRPLSLSQGEFTKETEITLQKFNVTKEECNGEFFVIDPKRNPFAALLGIKTRCALTMTANQTTNIIYGGNSGSPVVNFFGDVIGVIYAGNSKVINDSFMVPHADVKDFLENN